MNINLKKTLVVAFTAISLVTGTLAAPYVDASAASTYTKTYGDWKDKVIYYKTASKNVYKNTRYGYKIIFPSYMKKTGDSPTNGDGLSFKGQGIVMTVSAGHNALMETTSDTKKEFKNNGYKNVKVSGRSVTGYYDKDGVRTYVITYYLNDDYIMYGDISGSKSNLDKLKDAKNMVFTSIRKIKKIQD